MTSCSSAIAACVLMFAAGCTASMQATQDDVVAAVTTVARQMAANASAQDVRANLPFVPRTDKVVYVSDGAPITGTEYAKVLEASYSSRDAMSFEWERLEVTPLGSSAAAVTGWARTVVTPRGGTPMVQRYIFTMIFARDAGGWKRVLAQKAPLAE